MTVNWERSEDEVLATLQDVVAIESVNPSLPGGRDGEGGMVEYLSDFFEGIGLPVELTEALPGRHNLVARLEGQDPDRAVLFECHMDTASVEVMTIPPFEPHIRGGLMYGRGSADTKAGGVAMMHAMKRLVEAGVKPPRTILYAGSVDEEYLMRGARHLAPRVEVEAAVIAEPTDLAVIRGHKGVVRFHVTVEGKAAHSSKPYLGVNAISGMARLVTRLEKVVGADYASREDPLLGHPTMNIGVIEGGMQVNFVPDRCRIDVDVRTIPGLTTDDVTAQFAAVIAEEEGVDAALEDPYITLAAVGTAEEAGIVQSAVAACREVLGEAEIGGVPYGTDGSPFADRGVPTIILGPGSIDQAHGAVEWVECRQVTRAVDVYQRIMLSPG